MPRFPPAAKAPSARAGSRPCFRPIGAGATAVRVLNSGEATAPVHPTDQITLVDTMTAASIDPSPVLRAARDFAGRVAARWPVRTALLFGSQARGNAHSGSDTDVAVVLAGAPGDFVATKLAMDDVAYDVLLESGIRIQPLPIWEQEWAQPERYSNPRLLQNIAHDGLPL